MLNPIGRALAAIFAWLGAILPTVLRDGAGLAGAGAVSYGAWLVYQPAGFIVGGLLLIVGAILASRGDG